MEKCSYCKGTGFIGTGFIEKEEAGHRYMYPHTEPCYCRINNGINRKYGILSAVNQPLPSDTALVHKLFSSKNYIFYGSEDIFLYIVKAYFMQGFMYKNYLVLEGGTIVEQYNVPKDSSGDWLTTSHLNQYDLLAILFTSAARYTSLKDCVLEVIKNRGRIEKPTWVYSPSSDALEKSREYSIELEPFFEPYREISLEAISGLKGFTPKKMTEEKMGQTLNDRYAN